MKKIILILSVLLFSTVLTAQTFKNEMNGYYMQYSGAFPNAPLGVGFGKINKKGIGFFGTLKFDGQSPSDDKYMSNISYSKAKDSYEDEERGKIYVDYSITAGITGNISELFTLYGGISFFEISEYTKFYDSFQILGSNGDYIVLGPNDSEKLIGLNFGIIYKIIPNENSIIISLGYNINPNVFEFGLGYALDFLPY